MSLRRTIDMTLARSLRTVLPAALLALALSSIGARAALDPEILSSVPVVQDGRLTVATAQGEGALPIHVSRDWTVPEVRRVVVVIHGWPRRDLKSGEHAAAHAGDAARDAIIVTPQFLTQTDVDTHHLSPDVLHWGLSDWIFGYDAHGPAPVSSYEALDAILARLADRRIFPNLATVVIAGHSAGGQFVQRYAAVGRGQAPLEQAGIHVRYVVANPSSYLYFSPERPVATDAAQCHGVNRWRFGLDGPLPRYVATPVDAAALERAYRARDIVYLLGTADTDPNEHQLDRSCGAEAQGETRFARGLAYFAYLTARPSGPLNQRVVEVPGIAHHSAAMYGSACGLTALFDTPGCDGAAK
jgi:pimeloyl-ACP methyl ester carboxylesterase